MATLPPADQFAFSGRFTIEIREGQDIFDVTIQKFGTLENLFDFLKENDDITINSSLSSGQKVIINNTDKGLLNEKEFFSSRRFVVTNADADAIAETVGDYNNDFNNDFN